MSYEELDDFIAHIRKDDESLFRVAEKKDVLIHIE